MTRPCVKSGPHRAALCCTVAVKAWLKRLHCRIARHDDKCTLFAKIEIRGRPVLYRHVLACQRCGSCCTIALPYLIELAR